MKLTQLIATFVLVLLQFRSTAQSMVGVTGMADTSYSNRSAAASIRKLHPNAVLVEPMKLAAVKEKYNLTYCQVGDRKLQLDVFHPTAKSKAKKTAILIIHGGGWRSGNRTQHHALAQKLAGLGYVCFTPEYRLSTEALYPAAVYDLKAALRWIRKQAKAYGIDTAQVAVMGFSAGGQLAALLGTTNGNKKFEGETCHPDFSSAAQAIIDLDGTLSFVHPESGEGDDSKKTSAATYWFGYSKKENTGLWQEASPLTHVSKHTPPTLFINSSVARMHAGRDDFMKVMKEHNIYTNVKTFDDAPHHFPMFEPWFTPMVQTIDDFLKTVFRTKK
ncbi:MAG TPA: alpha/beta hydrolase [Flavisolibacter sp.]|nr:alpha/beta hydrolase [Flavisolibacter sp.]